MSNKTQLPQFGKYSVLRDYDAPKSLKRELGIDWLCVGMDIELSRGDAESLVGYGVLRFIREIEE